MNVLALDTCLGAVSVAVGCQSDVGARTFTELYEERISGHAERLLPMISQVMADAAMPFDRLQRIAVTLGPGSFTGVRTGVSVARALRLSVGAEVVGTTSLAVLAHAVLTREPDTVAGRPLLIAIDARRDRVYLQLFGASALDPLTAPAEMTIADARALAMRRPTVVAGSATSLIASALPQDAASTVTCLPGAAYANPRASDLLTLATSLVPLVKVAPLYIRPPDAKPQTGKSLVRESTPAAPTDPNRTSERGL